MSPASYGYFLQANYPHLVLQIHDHAIDAASRSIELGFAGDEFADFDPVRDRLHILSQVLGRGWIRVRVRGLEATVEHAWDWQQVIEALLSSGEELGLGSSAFLVVRHVETKGQIGFAFSDLRNMVSENRIEELIDESE